MNEKEKQELIKRAKTLHDTYPVSFTNNMTPEELQLKFHEMIKHAQNSTKHR